MDREQKIHHLKSKIEEAFSGSDWEVEFDLLLEYVFGKTRDELTRGSFAMVFKPFFRAEKEKQKTTLLSLIEDLPPDFFDSLRGDIVDCDGSCIRMAIECPIHNRRTGFELDNGAKGTNANTHFEHLCECGHDKDSHWEQACGVKPHCNYCDCKGFVEYSEHLSSGGRI